MALLGYGLAGASFHAPLIAATAGLRLSAIVTRDDERRARARRAHPEAALLASAADVWQAADELDLAVVAAPNRAHVPLALAALDAGLNVVVDKPLAPTAADARTLVEAARDRGLMLTVFQNRRWDGDFLTVRALLDERVLGQIFRFESRYERWRPEIAAGWREEPAREEAGGVLFDLGSHLVDQALVLVGRVDDVYSEIDLRRVGALVEDDVFVALTHASGVRSHLWMSAVAAERGARFRLLGDRGAFVKYGVDVQEEALRAARTAHDPAWGVEPEESWGEVAVDGDRRRVPTARGSYGAFYEGVAKSLRDGVPPPVDPEDAVAALEILEVARR